MKSKEPRLTGFTPKEVKRATGGVQLLGEGTGPLLGVSIDSRTIRAGELFIAIRGDRFDGHLFVAEALAKGAGGAVVDHWPLVGEPIPGTDFSVWKVSDTRKALLDLARFHRDRFKLDLVAVTGSCGKTTTKTMLAHLLSGSRPVLATPGTRNNLIGVPLTLLELRPSHRAAILELGTNRWGEIRKLTKVTRPTVGVVTNIGFAHLETFKTLKGVLRAKGELWQAMDSGATLVLNADDPLLWQAGTRLNRRVVWFGTTPKADVRATAIQWESWGVRCRIRRQELQLPLLGRHNLINALAALACAELLGESLGDLLERFWDVPRLPGRLFLRRLGGILFLDDTYNANPDSLQAALQVFKVFPRQGRRFLVMGDMLELGRRAKALHAEAAATVMEAGVEGLITVGPLAREMLLSAWEGGLALSAGRAFDSAEEAAACLLELLRPGDVVLLKGSRRLRMEQILTPFQIRPTLGPPAIRR